MPHSRFTGDEIHKRGEDLYEHQLRFEIETDDNIGRILSIDIETGDYEIGDDLLVTGRRLQAKHPDAAIYGKKIGYDAVFSIGGSVERIVRA